MKITNWALTHRTSIFVMLFILIMAGFTAYNQLPVESFPQIEQPVVIVSVPYFGVSPVDMENLVATPVENKLNELKKIKQMSSVCTEGLVTFTVEFQPDMEIDEAVRKIREKVDQAKPDLPQDAEDAIIQEVNFENIPIMLVSIVGNQSLVRLKEIAEMLEDKLEQIPGILDITLSGGLEKEVQVNINPARLRMYALSVDDVIRTIRSENTTIPGGSIESGRLKYSVRIPGEFKSVQELNTVVVKTIDDQAVYLYDLADVQMGFEESTSRSRLDGRSSVTLSVQKRSGENILRVTNEVKAMLAREAERFPPQTEYFILADQSKDIRSMVSDLENNIISGLILVIAVLAFFMGARNGLLVGLAIPLSMLLSFIIQSLLGYTLNMIVLFSLILALGMLVDNAIVIVENIYRHHQDGKSLLSAAREATEEVGMAVIASTVTTLFAFAPLMFWPGIVGDFMSFLPITLIITLASSLIIALVFNPVISSSFLKRDQAASILPGDRLIRWLNGRYEHTLYWVLQRRGTTLSLTVGAYLLIFIVYGAFNPGVEFFPETEPKQAWVDIKAPTGTRLEATNDITRTLEERLHGLVDTQHMISRVGNVSSDMDFGAGGGEPHRSQITVDFFDKEDRQQSSYKTLQEIRQRVEGIPGAQIDVSRPQEGPPTGKAVEIQIKGNDFTILSALADSIKHQIQSIPGLSELRDNYEPGKPELQIRVDREKAALIGLNTSRIASTIRTAVNGTEASEYRVGQDEYDITVRFDKDYRRHYSDLLNLTIFHERRHLPLSNVATIDFAAGLSNVNHVDTDRVVTVTAEAFGRRSAEVLADVKTRLAGFTPPPEYSIEFAGQDEEQRAASDFLTRAFFIAILLILLVLVTQFNSVTLPFVILISVILSFFGVFVGLLITYRPFGIIMTGIGIISLAGIVVNNGIVLIDYIQKLRQSGLNKVDAIVEGGKTRLRPVILTAITTILGLIPLTVGISIDFVKLVSGDWGDFIAFGAESSQWWSGMGIVVIFGLMFSTALTLIIVPVLYDIFSDLLDVWYSKIKRKANEFREKEPAL